jgi:DNA-binding NarL/FixJ family response regulator
MRVLIADDSLAVLERLADLLKDIPGVQLIGTAQDAPEAIQSVVKESPDAIILDLQMPGGSGLEVLRTVRQSHPSLCVLICTNYPFAQYREKCFAAGANYFLDKSAEFDKIPQIFRDLVARTPNVATAASPT